MTVIDAVDTVKGTAVCQLITQVKAGAGYTTPIRHRVNQVGAGMKANPTAICFIASPSLFAINKLSASRYYTTQTVPCEPGLHSLPASRKLPLSRFPVRQRQLQIKQSRFL